MRKKTRAMMQQPPPYITTRPKYGEIKLFDNAKVEIVSKCYIEYFCAINPSCVLFSERYFYIFRDN